MARERPINADVPAPDGEPEAAERPTPAPATEPKPAAAPAKQKPQAAPRRRRRRPIPGALKGIAALVALAIVFIVAAVVGGSGGSGGGGESAAPAPAVVSTPSKGAAETPSSQGTAELGYPAFATDNTTRLGGSEAAANAAAAALAVFPSTTESQRPTAVALASEDDWQAALAAAVLMAAPLRAPLLFAGADQLPDVSAEALAALDPAGGAESHGAALFAIGAVAGTEGRKTTRVASGSPAVMAAAIARLRERLSGGAPRHFLVAPLGSAGLAMPAAAWAARSGDPVLFSASKRLPKATAAALERHPKVPVYVLGPASAISSAVISEISKIGEDVRRVGDKGPVTNAIAFARYANGNFGWDVNDPGHGFVLARDEDPLEAAAAAPLSGAGTWGPLLLTDSATTLPDPVREYLLDVKPGYTNDPTRAFYNHVWVIGDQEAIDVNQQAEVSELAELAKIGGEE